jgi:hypothetical protein
METESKEAKNKKLQTERERKETEEEANIPFVRRRVGRIRKHY